MPQMNFANPLTTSQVVWMAVIMVVLYLVLASWGLPAMGAVLKNRADIIAADIAAARAAKEQADAAVKQLNRDIANARQIAQAEIAQAVTAAKAQAADQAAALGKELDAKLDAANAQIDAARTAALAAIKPVAVSTAGVILGRLTGTTPDEAALNARVDAAMAKAA
jgi:F-type H+-transporting ATPase subunit b